MSKRRLLGSNITILDHIPTSDTNYWGDSIVIIRGEIINKNEEQKERALKKLEVENLAHQKKMDALAKLTDEDKKILGIK